MAELAEAQKQRERELRQSIKELRSGFGALEEIFGYAFENEADRRLPDLLRDRFGIAYEKSLFTPLYRQSGDQSSNCRIEGWSALFRGGRGQTLDPSFRGEGVYRTTRKTQQGCKRRDGDFSGDAQLSISLIPVPSKPWKRKGSTSFNASNGKEMTPDPFRSLLSTA